MVTGAPGLRHSQSRDTRAVQPPPAFVRQRMGGSTGCSLSVLRAAGQSHSLKHLPSTPHSHQGAEGSPGQDSALCPMVTGMPGLRLCPGG